MFWSFIGIRKGLVINRVGGYIRKGNQLLVGEDSPLAKAKYARRIPLDGVHAVQLICEFVTPDAMESYLVMSNDSFSYELNVIPSTGERIKVMDRHHDDEIREPTKRSP